MNVQFVMYWMLCGCNGFFHDMITYFINSNSNSNLRTIKWFF